LDNVEIIAKLRKDTSKAIERKEPGVSLDKRGFDENLLQTLICLECRGNLVYVEEKDVLICQGCEQVYEVRNGVPIMLKRK
jgi:uncharacterized protein YbaR (Trm112 family)